MNQQGHLHQACFLNRIAAGYNGNPVNADPIEVLKAFFGYAARAEQIKAFDNYCLAALKDGYGWQHGSPANALHYGEQLELLVEAAYLIHQQAERFKWEPQAVVTLPLTELPMLLTAKEFINPVGFLARFFAREPLPRWKQLLNMFTTAALSNSPVTDDMDAADIFNFIHYLKKLVYIASRLLELKSRD